MTYSSPSGLWHYIFAGFPDGRRPPATENEAKIHESNRKK